jgi:hypothetical protein
MQSLPGISDGSGRLRERVLGVRHSGVVRDSELSLDSADYDRPPETMAEETASGLRLSVPSAVLALLPERSHTFGYILDDEGRLFVRFVETRKVR